MGTGKLAIIAIAVGLACANDSHYLKLSASFPETLDDLEGRMTEQVYDLRKPEDLSRLKEAQSKLLELGEKQDAWEEAHPERFLPFSHDLSSRGKRRALQEALALLDQSIAAGGPTDSVRTHRLLELVHALENSFRYPAKKNYQLVPDIFPALLLRMNRHLTVPADPKPQPDPPAPDPSIWRDPGDLSELDLYAGFRRTARPHYEDQLCEYRGPKTGWGAHPGFGVRCGNDELTLKLGDERYGGPFNTRIFDALGYHVIPIDPVARLRLRYDRRVLTEYNSRKLLTLHAKFLFIPLQTRTITDVEDPFARIEYGVLRNGRRLSAAELKRQLLRDTTALKGRPRPETVPTNYDAEFERGIDHIVWQAGIVEHESDEVQSIGAWDYNQLDHPARREIRALFVLAAWVDQFNLRWENTRLAYVRDSLTHLLSDVGSGLGLAKDLRHTKNSDVDAMLWEVTEQTDDGSVRFSGFASVLENEAFASLTGEDARWILRRIGSLSEQQILAALLATGMSAAEVRLALEKLLSKRRKLIEDFGLASEFPGIASRRIERLLDFDPRDKAELRKVSLQTAGGWVVPVAANSVVRAGRLEKSHLVQRPPLLPPS